MNEEPLTWANDSDDTDVSPIITAYCADHPPVNHAIYLHSSKHGMEVSGEHGAGAGTIYNLLAIAVKTIIEKFESEGHPIDLIEYYGLVPRTEIAYQRLFDLFLKRDYVRVGRQHIMKRRVFEGLKARFPSFASHQSEAEASHAERLSQLKAERRQLRRIFSLFRQPPGA
ncbi:MAG: hypothetical protein EBS89_11620 [Proteobacteria bacterium]|nr:hypothetical protein [Pseudomonadota bacterium]